MNELNDFLKVLAAGKKEKAEKVAEATEQLGDFLGVVAEAKAQDPKHQMLKQVKQHVKADISGLFEQLGAAKVDVITPEPTAESAELDVITPTVVGEFVLQEGKYCDPVTLTEVVVPEVRPAAEIYTKAEIDDLLKHNASFQQPDPKLVDANISAVQQKLKFLEQAIGKIAATGPGSGEVNFRWLDDVNRATMTESNDNWVLEYDATTKKVQFTENVGPIRTVGFKTAGPLRPLTAGELAWNPSEDCLDVQHEDGSKLQAGLETHMRVYNAGATTLTVGTFVGFAGAVEIDGDELPIAAPYTATVTANPLYVIGVLTTPVEPGGVGRATLYGKVRGLDTTGDSGLGETWNVGDLLWSHPTMAGRLTKVQPTAPYPAISVAAVMRKSSTAGVLLVRPTIFPRLWSGDWYSTENQSITTINTPKRISVNNAGVAIGFTNNDGLITALHTGQYNFQFSLQIISSNSSAAYYYIWYRKNGQDVPYSATKLSISSNSVVLAPSWNFPVSLQANDTFELMWACDSLNVSLSALPATSFCPAIPSVILTVQQMNL